MITRIRRFCRSLAKRGGASAFILALSVKVGLYKGIKICPSKPFADRYADLAALNAFERIDSGIPKIIFQTWKSRIALPNEFYYWSQTVISTNPTHLHVVWDDHDNRQFICSHFAWFLQIYDAFPAEIYRADAVRPFFLFFFGGIYLDMDVEGLRPMRLPPGADVIVGRMGFERNFKHSIPNAIIASKPRQLFWLLFIAIVIERFEKNNGVMIVPEDITGPVVLKAAFDYYLSSSTAEVIRRAWYVLGHLPSAIVATVSAGRVVERDPAIWYPLDWHDPIHRRLRSIIRKKKVVVGPTVARILFGHAEFATFWTHHW